MHDLCMGLFFEHMFTNKIVCLVFLLTSLVNQGQSKPNNTLVQNPDMVKFSGVILKISPEEGQVCNASVKTIEVQILKVLYKGRTVNLNLQPQTVVTILIDSKIPSEKIGGLQADQILTFHAMEKLCSDDAGSMLTALSWVFE